MLTRRPHDNVGLRSIRGNFRLFPERGESFGLLITPMVRTLANIGLVLVSVALAFVVALGALEAYLRLADPLGDQINHPGIYRANQVWGYSYLPSQGFRVSHAEFVNDMTTDQLGFLARSVGRWLEGPRIVILGDSFMAGFSIPDGQVFSRACHTRGSGTLPSTAGEPTTSAPP